MKIFNCCKKNRENPFVLAPIFIWIGFVCSISFMEAWLKFRAPGVTLPIGLGIGRLVFTALNKAEWIFAILTAFFIFFSNYRSQPKKLSFFSLAFVILIVQTFILLPKLIGRAQLISQGLPVPPSSVHFLYVILEVAKVFSLFILGITIICDLTKRLSLKTS